MNKAYGLLLLITTFLVGCMTVPISANKAEAIDRKFIYAGQQTASSYQTVQVTIVRDSGGTLFGVTMNMIRVYCDGVKLADLNAPSTKYTFFVSPGIHTINVTYINPSGIELKQGLAGINVQAIDGQTIHLATGVNPAANEPMRLVQVMGDLAN